MFTWPVLQLKKVSNMRALLLFEQWNFIEFLYLCHFFLHLLLSVMLAKTARLKNFNSLTGFLTELIPPWWWHFPIYIIFLILVIMFRCIKLRLSNSSDDFSICQKMRFWSNNIFICIYIPIDFKSNWRFTLVLKFFKLCCKQFKRIIIIWLRAWLSELPLVFLKQFTNVVGKMHSQAAVSKVMASKMLTFVGDRLPSMLVI